MEKQDLRDAVTVLIAMCEGIGTPRSLAVKLLAEHGEWDQLVDLAVDPRHYHDSEAYWKDRQATDFFRKLDGLPLNRDLHQAAVSTFWDCEKQCYKSNERLSIYLEAGTSFLDAAQSRIKSGFLSSVRKLIADVLGPVPNRLHGDLGPGSTFSDKGRRNTVPHKFSSVPSLTREVVPFLKFEVDNMWTRVHNSRGGVLDFVRGNRFTSVPKDSKKNRGICVEPSLNLWFQKGIGRHIRLRLKNRLGIDLDDGQDTHRLLACEASKTGLLATLDLSNASDTVCTNLVKLVLPPLWFQVLDSLRSHYTFIEGRWVRLEKFSSMGNGFTFELETLIFYAIARVASNMEQVWAFGDDLIVPSDSFGDVVSALSYFGFSTNQTKSFGSGPFRESCGGDFFGGTAVRPFFLKSLPHEPQEWIALANGLYRSGLFGVPGTTRFRNLRVARERALAFVPAPIRRLRGPVELGDLVVNDHESLWNYRTTDSIRWFRCYMPVSNRRVPWHLFSEEVKLASILYGTGWDERGVIPRESVTGYRIGRVAWS